MEDNAPENIDSSPQSPPVKCLSESSQPRFSRLSFTSKASNSQKRDSSIIHVDTGEFEVGGRKRISDYHFRFGCEPHKDWRQKLRVKLDGMAFTIASILFTMMVRAIYLSDDHIEDELNMR